MFWASRVLNQLTALVALASAILKVLRLKKPNVVFIKIVSQEGNMLKFKLLLPPAGAKDVVKRNLLVQIGTGEPKTTFLDGSAVESELLEGADNDAITGSLVDVDDANNASEPRTFSFVLVDTIPPPQPGEIGVSVVSED